MEHDSAVKENYREAAKNGREMGWQERSKERWKGLVRRRQWRRGITETEKEKADGEDGGDGCERMSPPDEYWWDL